MTLFGERQGPERFVPKIIDSIYHDEILPIHVKEGRPGMRSYLHARNASDAILFILNNVDVKAYPEFDRPERFNIVGDAYLDNLELADHIARLMNRTGRYQMIDMNSVRPGQDLRYGIDGSKLAGLGYKFPLSFEESIAKSVEWMTRPENLRYLRT
jgi:dTDP-glucose 4,6-dehydratase